MDNGNQQLVTRNGAGSIMRQEFGKRELEVRHETAATAVATQAAEMVRARCTMALERPRSMMLVRQRLLDACDRPGFAETARFAKPMGKKLNEETGQWEQQYARGFSIRFAEEAVRVMGNIDVETMIKFDNGRQRILRIVVLDLEGNNGYPSDIIIEKSVERRKLKQGQAAITQRTNSYGDTVYIVEATEDEMLVKAAALTSKQIRTNVLRLVPGDIQEDCLLRIHQTTANEQAKDPKATLKKLLDRLQLMGISVEQVAQYLGHAVDTTTPEEIRELIEVGTAIKEGDTSWAEVMADRSDDRAVKDEKQTEPTAEAEAAPRTAADLKAKAAKSSTKAKKPEETPAATAPAAPSPAAAPAGQQKMDIPIDKTAAAQEPDDGQCLWSDVDTGEVCPNQGIRYSGYGFRCLKHKP